MSLINLLKKKSKSCLFTTPSHSGNIFLFSKLRQLYKMDISETDTHNPQEALDTAQKKAAKIYGTKSTHFLTNGSTSGIIAAILCCVEKGEKVLIWDDAHPCHKNAVELAGAVPVFYKPEFNQEWGIFADTQPDIIEEKLKNEKIKAVIITSPTYEGIVSNIKLIKKVCEKYGTYLIVDEAHGALYPFCDELPESAIYQGADFVNQSLHKTAGGLNPTALLHCNVDKNIQEALNKFSTTSPSYPILASIEKNISYLNSKKGRLKISQLIKTINKLKSNVNSCDFYTDIKNHDCTKILIKNKNMTGEELSEFLFDNSIEDERTNNISTMLLCGIGTDETKLARLEKILKKLSK